MRNIETYTQLKLKINNFKLILCLPVEISNLLDVFNKVIKISWQRQSIWRVTQKLVNNENNIGLDINTSLKF